MERKTIRIKFTDGQEPIEMKSDLIFINYSMISNLLLKLRNIKKNQIEFIRYLNSDNSWESLKSNTSDINIADLNSIDLKVKLFIKEKPDANIKEMINKTKKINSSLVKDLLEIKGPQSNINVSQKLFSSNISKNSSQTHEQQNSISLYEEKPDIIVLTANPLAYFDSYNLRELRTMNEFNNINDSIYRIVSKSKLCIKTKFLTLTLNNFIYALEMKPSILHLICKSTYISDDINLNSNKKISPTLLFENEFCQMEIITINII